MKNFDKRLLVLHDLGKMQLVWVKKLITNLGIGRLDGLGIGALKPGIDGSYQPQNKTINGPRFYLKIKLLSGVFCSTKVYV